jgi:AraC family transcriptional regulator of adaptative response/methylated-DNA-[protein]-cysteine methyltransferase
MATQQSAYPAPAELTFATWRCWLGWAGVVLDAAGIWAIALNDSPAALQQDFAQQFPETPLTLLKPTEDARVAAVQQLVEQPDHPHTLPLAPVGTAFQCDVWTALQAIPAGQTLTYQALATQLGQPRSARAVAHACGKNPWAIAIPCHRVIGRDGSLTGYRWGIERKQALLERETLLPHPIQLSIL